MQIRDRIFSLVRWLVAGWIWIAIAACSGQAPSPTNSPLSPSTAESALSTPEPPTYSDTTGAIVGRVQIPEPSWTNIKAYLAPFYPDETGQNGFYVLEPSIHRNVDVRSDGYFQASDVEAGQYVIVVGPSPEDARAVAEGGVPRVFRVEAGELLNVGEVQLLSN